MRLVLAVFLPLVTCFDSSYLPNCLKHDPDLACVVDKWKFKEHLTAYMKSEIFPGTECVRFGSPACYDPNGYLGYKNKTSWNVTCLMWNTTAYGLQEEHNYCRSYPFDPANDADAEWWLIGGGPWCNTAIGKKLCFPACNEVDQCYLNDNTSLEGMFIMTGAILTIGWIVEPPPPRVLRPGETMPPVIRPTLDMSLYSDMADSPSYHLEDCMTRCRGQCFAWSFGPNNNTDTNFKWKNVCTLFDRSDHGVDVYRRTFKLVPTYTFGWKCSKSWTTQFIYFQQVFPKISYDLTESKCNFLQGVEIQETDTDQQFTQPLGTKYVAYNCCRICWKTDNCVGYTWTEGTCKLKSVLNFTQVQRSANKMIVSGVVRQLCDPTMYDTSTIANLASSAFGGPTEPDDPANLTWVWLLLSALIVIIIVATVYIVVRSQKRNKTLRSQAKMQPKSISAKALPEETADDFQPMFRNVVGRLRSSASDTTITESTTTTDASQTVLFEESIAPEGHKMMLHKYSTTEPGSSVVINPVYDVHLITEYDPNRSRLAADPTSTTTTK